MPGREYAVRERMLAMRLRRPARLYMRVTPADSAQMQHTPSASSATEQVPGGPAAGEDGASPVWRRTLLVMIGIQIVMTLAFTVLSPVMPLFLPELGVHDPARIDIWAGVLTSITSFIAAFASPFWGRVADTYGRKSMVIRSCFAIGLFTALMSLALNVWQFLALRALMGAFAGFTAATITLVASQVPPRKLGYALGWLSTGQLVGSLIGPVAGGTIADITGSYRIPFLVTAVLTGTCSLAAWRLVPEHFVRPKSTARKPSMIESLRVVTRSPGLLPLFLVLLLAQFGVMSVQPVVTLFVQQLAGLRPDVATLGGFAFSVTGVGDLIASPFLGRRSDVLGYRRVLLICLGGAALTSAPQAFVHSYAAFVAARFGLGLFVGGILPTANALVGRLASSGDRGLIYGMTASAMFLGGSLGPFCGGAIAATLGLRWVFLVTALLLTANLIWVFVKVPEVR